MNILELIEKRYSCNIERDVPDKMLIDASKSKNRDVAVILTENVLTRCHGLNSEYVIALRDNNRLKGMFDLGIVLPNTNARFILYIFTKDRVDSFIVGEYRGSAMKNRAGRKENNDWNSLYTSEYYNYLRKIEDGLKHGKYDNDDYVKFNTVKNELFEGVFDPKRYSESVYRVKNALKMEKTVCLSEVAQIIRPRPNSDRDKRAMHLMVSEWKYPIDYNRLRDGIMTDTPIRQNDILFRDFNRIYLMTEKPEKEIHISPNDVIIRPNNISPYYLAMYLKSDTAKIIMQSLSMGSVLTRIRMTDMLNIPVILSSLTDSDYKRMYELEYHQPKDIAEFHQNKRLNAYYDAMTSIKGRDKDSCTDILSDEWMNNIRIHKRDVLKEFIESDIDELNVCFRHKAYKAALILAGSILEAILIDWLSEIKNENYFDESYLVQKKQWDKRNNCPKRDRNGNILYYTKEAGLADYIDEIKELARPAWMKSDEAHLIRKKRNLVHAKLCLKDSTEINEQTCREVIDYLKEVIDTRGIQKL